MGANTHILDKELISRICREFLEFNKMIKSPFFKTKMAECFNRYLKDAEMANKYMKRCSLSIVNRKTKIKITMKYHCTSQEWLNLKRWTIPSVAEDAKPSPAGGSIKWSNYLEKLVQFLTKLNINIYTKETLFKIAKHWKQPKCPKTGKWINKLWFIYLTEYTSTIKRNEVSMQHG